MNRRIVALLLCCAPVVLGAPAAMPAAPYADQQTRQIKSLSPEDVDAYLSGKGMGMAKAAELNGYPGPAHVLELASELSLTPEQRAKTQALFARMESEAKAPGRDLVDAERKLDQLFAAKTITPDSLESTLAEIGALQVKVRRAHLSAHLAQAQILTPTQNALYASLRGYGNET